MQKNVRLKITSCLFAAHFFADDTANAEFLLSPEAGHCFLSIVIPTGTALNFCSFHGCHHCREHGVQLEPNFGYRAVPNDGKPWAGSSHWVERNPAMRKRFAVGCREKSVLS